MARNKYPEVTVERILDAAQRLFLEKGYDNTTIQDIVDELGGLTKGAVYHHFKSKEEILDAVGTGCFSRTTPSRRCAKRADLNGLQKLQEAVRLNQADTARTMHDHPVHPAEPQPPYAGGNAGVQPPHPDALLRQLIEEGNRDGSMHTAYAREISELMPPFDQPVAAAVGLPATREQMKTSSLFGRYAGKDGRAPDGRFHPPPGGRLFCPNAGGARKGSKANRRPAKSRRRRSERNRGAGRRRKAGKSPLCVGNGPPPNGKKPPPPQGTARPALPAPAAGRVPGFTVRRRCDPGRARLPGMPAPPKQHAAAAGPHPTAYKQPHTRAHAVRPVSPATAAPFYDTHLHTV